MTPAAEPPPKSGEATGRLTPAGRAWIACGIVVLAVTIAGAAFYWWLILSLAAALGPLGEAIADAIKAEAGEDSRAAAELARAPAPPPVAGSEGQAAALGPAFVAAWDARDADALNELVDRTALLRGLVDPETVVDLNAAGDADAAAVNPFLPVARRPAGDGFGEGEAYQFPPGARAAYWPLDFALRHAFDRPQEEYPVGIEFAGVETHDELPAAVLLVTFPAPDDGSGPVPPDATVTRRALLIPTPDGQVGEVYVEEGLTFLGPPADRRGEYLSEALRRGLIDVADVLAPFLKMNESPDAGDGGRPPVPAGSPRGGGPS